MVNNVHIRMSIWNFPNVSNKMKGHGVLCNLYNARVLSMFRQWSYSIIVCNTGHGLVNDIPRQ